MAANYQTSILVDAIAILSKRFNAAELRPGFFGATDAFFKNREFSIPNLAEIRKSPQRTTTVKYLTRTTQSPVTARSCSPSAALGTSGTANVTWVTKGFTIYTSAKLADNNYFSAAQMFANDLYNGMLDAHEDLEAACVAFLEANKTGVNVAGSLTGTFDGTDDIFEIAKANQDRYFNYIATVMRENKYRNNLIAINNVSAMAIINEQLAQGAGNDANLAYQYGGLTLLESSNVTVGSDYLMNSYVMDSNAISILDWIPPLNQSGLKEGEAEWTVMGDIFGLPVTWSVFKKHSCADTTSIGGDTQDSIIEWEVTCDFGLVAAPITVSTETPIFKFGLKTS